MANVKYTWDDIIISPYDTRIEIGAEYFFGDSPLECLNMANGEKCGTCSILIDVRECEEWPFACASNVEGRAESFVCIIRKKEPKYVPFDLSRPEVRESLMMKKIINKDGFSEEMIWRFMNVLSDAEENTHEWIINNSIHENDLLKHWTFSDGTPCGELVEVDE